MRPPHYSAVLCAAFLALDGCAAYVIGVRILALPFAGLALAALGVLWRGPDTAPVVDGDLEALLNATRECRACSPGDYGPCTCTKACASIRCTAAFPPNPNFTDRDTRELTGR